MKKPTKVTTSRTPKNAVDGVKSHGLVERTLGEVEVRSEALIEYWNKRAELLDEIAQIEHHQRKLDFGDRSLDAVLKAARARLVELDSDSGDAGGVPSSEPETAAMPQHAPLSTPVLADCLDGVNGWDAEAWRNVFGNRRKWLGDPVIPGVRGRHHHHWNPLVVARNLVQHEKPLRMPDKQSMLKLVFQIRRAFKRKELLQPWRDGWDEFEVQFVDFD